MVAFAGDHFAEKQLLAVATTRCWADSSWGFHGEVAKVSAWTVSADRAGFLTADPAFSKADHCFIAQVMEGRSSIPSMMLPQVLANW